MDFIIEHWIDITFFSFTTLAIIVCYIRLKKRNPAYKNYIVLFIMILLARVVQVAKRPFMTSSLMDRVGSLAVYIFIIIGIANFYLGYKKEKSTKLNMVGRKR